MGTQTDGASAVIEALTNMRRLVAQLDFPLELASEPSVAADAAVLATQLDDLLDPHQLPGVSTPVLRTVVTGPTGAGKSTIINTIVGADISPVGVLRPTTRQPVLVCHPTATDQLTGAWLPSSVRIASSAEIHDGAVFLDVPDVDSVVRTAATHPDDRGGLDDEAAQRLLAAADQWLFVTTAARYADAVPWRALKVARARGTALAIVLNRVPAVATDEIRDHMVALLDEHELNNLPLFVICEEATIDGQVSQEAIGGIRAWLDATNIANTKQCAEPSGSVTTDVVLTGLWPRLNALADEMENQLGAAKELGAAARAAFALALTTMRADLESGAVLRGEALARWRDFVAAGDLLRALESRSGHWASLWGSWSQAGAIARCIAVNRVITESLTALLTANLIQASDDVASSWRRYAAGEQTIANAGAEFELPAAALRAEISTLVLSWQERVQELVRTEQVSRRTAARLSEYGRAATATVVTVAALTPLSIVDSESELLAGDRAAAVVVSDHVVRRLAAKARMELLTSCQQVTSRTEERFTAILAELIDVQAQAELPAKLRAAAIMVESARKNSTNREQLEEVA